MGVASCGELRFLKNLGTGFDPWLEYTGLNDYGTRGIFRLF